MSVSDQVKQDCMRQPATVFVWLKINIYVYLYICYAPQASVNLSSRICWTNVKGHILQVIATNFNAEVTER